jgi:hypothetical protein
MKTLFLFILRTDHRYLSYNIVLFDITLKNKELGRKHNFIY